MTTRHHGAVSPHKERGFTLTEMLVTLGVFAILLGLATPSFRDLLLSQRVKNASFDLFASVIYARSEAIMRDATVTIVPAGASWSSGWKVVTADGSVLKTQNALPNLTLTGPASVTYNSMGRLDTAIAPFSLTDVAASNSRCISIDMSGRPRVALGTCS